jgi:hypothetical protein
MSDQWIPELVAKGGAFVVSEKLRSVYYVRREEVNLRFHIGRHVFFESSLQFPAIDGSVDHSPWINFISENPGIVQKISLTLIHFTFLMIDITFHEFEKRDNGLEIIYIDDNHLSLPGLVEKFNKQILLGNRHCLKSITVDQFRTLDDAVSFLNALAETNVERLEMWRRREAFVCNDKLVDAFCSFIMKSKIKTILISDTIYRQITPVQTRKIYQAFIDTPNQLHSIGICIDSMSENESGLMIAEIIRKQKLLKMFDVVSFVGKFNGGNQFSRNVQLEILKARKEQGGLQVLHGYVFGFYGGEIEREHVRIGRLINFYPTKLMIALSTPLSTSKGKKKYLFTPDLIRVLRSYFPIPNDPYDWAELNF